MKRLSRSLGLAALALGAVVFTASADERPAVSLANRAGHDAGLRQLRHCLSSLDLSADQKSAIQTIFSDAKPMIQADIQTVRADHQKLESDVANGSDKCVVGQDALTTHADAAKIRSDFQSVRDQILGKLTSDQQNKLTGCLQSSAAGRFGGRWSPSGD